MLPYFIFLMLLSSNLLESSGSSLDDSKKARSLPTHLIPSAQPAQASDSSAKDLFTPKPLPVGSTFPAHFQNARRGASDSSASQASRPFDGRRPSSLGVVTSCLDLAIRRHSRSTRSLQRPASSDSDPDETDHFKNCSDALEEAKRELSKSLETSSLGGSPKTTADALPGQSK